MIDSYLFAPKLASVNICDYHLIGELLCNVRIGLAPSKPFNSQREKKIYKWEWEQDLGKFNLFKENGRIEEKYLIRTCNITELERSFKIIEGTLDWCNASV